MAKLKFTMQKGRTAFLIAVATELEHSNQCRLLVL